MDTTDSSRSGIPEDELHALVDGRLAPEAAAALRQRLASDQEATATVAAWQTQREALQALYDPIAQSPLPASLLAAAEHAQNLQTQAAQWRRWGGMAAAVLIAFGAGLPASINSRKRLRARERRDITVPIGMARTLAASL